MHDLAGICSDAGKGWWYHSQLQSSPVPSSSLPCYPNPLVQCGCLLFVGLSHTVVWQRVCVFSGSVAPLLRSAGKYSLCYTGSRWVWGKFHVVNCLHWDMWYKRGNGEASHKEIRWCRSIIWAYAAFTPDTSTFIHRKFPSCGCSNCQTVLSSHLVFPSLIFS